METSTPMKMLRSICGQFLVKALVGRVKSFRDICEHHYIMNAPPREVGLLKVVSRQQNGAIL